MWASLPFDAQLLLLRGAALLVLYLFVGLVILALMGDLRRASRRAPQAADRAPDRAFLGHLVLVEAGPTGMEPEKRFGLDSVSAIGRSLRNTVSLDDDYLSAEHALLSWREGTWWLEDLGSTNGTFLNGVRVTRPVPVRTGDIIELGRVALRLEGPNT